jgi:hypothetical protein
MDSNNREVMRIIRENGRAMGCSCCICCCKSCGKRIFLSCRAYEKSYYCFIFIIKKAQEATIEAPPGKIVGYIRQTLVYHY